MPEKWKVSKRERENLLSENEFFTFTIGLSQGVSEILNKLLSQVERAQKFLSSSDAALEFEVSVSKTYKQLEKLAVKRDKTTQALINSLYEV